MKKLCVAFEGNKEFELLDEGDINERIITFIKANSKNVRIFKCYESIRTILLMSCL